MANPLTSQQFVRLLDKRLREVSENRFNELPTMLPEVFVNSIRAIINSFL